MAAATETDLEDYPPPPPTDRWAPDILGAGFYARTLPLDPDDEGEVDATLVKHVPADDPSALPGTPSSPRFAVLYLHGWNDYVMHTEAARELARLGGAFYGLDLRKYGRSLRRGQSRGYVEDLRTYDEDVHAARDVISEELGLGTDLVLVAHSTGGLVASLWAHRHPGALRALVLTSPWIAPQFPRVVGTVSAPVVSQLARTAPKTVLPFSGTDFYSRILGGVAEGELVPEGEEEDPFWTGWNPDPRWRLQPSGPIRPGWLGAILQGQKTVRAGLEISCPVLVLTSSRTDRGVKFTPEMRESDIVLDVVAIREAAAGLAPLVTLATFEGAIHDVLLSAPQVRRRVYSEIGRWSRAYVWR